MRTRIVGGIAFALLLVGAPAASAHAVLISMTPAAGSVVATAPAQVTLRFQEPVDLTPAGVRVYDDRLRRVDDGRAGHLTGHRDTVGVRVQPNLGSGTYTVTFRVVSGDSHPVAGAFTFSVGAPSTVRGSVGDVTGGSRTVGLGLGAARFVEYAGLAVGLGGLIFLALWPAGRRDHSARYVVRGGLIALFAGSIAALFLEGPYVAGTGWGSILDGRTMSTVVTSHFGVALIMRVVVVGLIVVLYRVLLDRGPYGYPMSVAGIAVVLADTFADAGHSSINDNYGLALLSDGAHVLAMTTWLGGLVLLVAVVLRCDPGALPALLPRFSRVALGCITVIAGTGAYQAIRNVGYWPALVDTTYGRLILAKIAGLLLVVGLGYLARRSVLRGTLPIRRALMAEVATAVAVLVVTSVLVATVPGKTDYAAIATTFTVG
ncbi:MAG: copper transport protein [Frankiaceae bacterium]|nr:copper transport protein [Frankiaceae bacterium]